jgi:DNA (cytosine-5)-methyltransferase 1
MTHGSLFSGIGGFDLAAEWMGWENVFHCEWNPFRQKVLKYYWPNAISYGDITKTDFNVHRGKIDILTGGFPCQPYSTAGKRKGKEDDRHLWPEMLRAIREIQPTWIVGENVPGLLNWERGMVLAEIKADLEAEGFEVFTSLVLPACSKNAPHKRDRLWIVAHSYSSSKSEIRRDNAEVCGFQNEECGSENGSSLFRGNNFEVVTNSNHKGLQGCEINGSIGEIGQNGNEQFAGFIPSTWQNFPTQPPLCGRDDGIPNRVDRIKALGNAIVPQVAYEIFKAIEKTEKP